MVNEDPKTSDIQLKHKTKLKDRLWSTECWYKPAEVGLVARAGARNGVAEKLIISTIWQPSRIQHHTPQENLFESPQEEVAVTNVYCKIGTDQIKIVAPKRGIPAAGPELIW